MTYRPQPLDTSKVALSDDLHALAEALARNMHDFWAGYRINDGWSHGALHDHALRRHPDLLPYEQLSEEGRRFDRASAVEVLKAIQAWGYSIQPPVGGGAEAAAPAAAAAFDPRRLSLAELTDVWQSWDREHPSGPPQVYAAMGGRALELGEYLLAFDVLKVGLRHHPGDQRLRQLQATVLARTGAVDQAIRQLDQLIKAGADDVESLGGVASTTKALWEQAVDPAQRSALLTRAITLYENAYRRESGYWLAINVATLAACQGDSARAAEYVAMVRADCGGALARLPDRHGREAYWPLATLAEAALVMKEFDRAEDLYRQAVRAAPGDIGTISSTRRNARLLLAAWGRDDVVLNEWLPLPSVAIFAGHMIDKPERREPRFPPKLEPLAARHIRDAVAELNAGIGYASAACGADILFLEAVLERGPSAEANIVLPYDTKQFIADCVDYAGGDWTARLHRIMDDPRVRVTEVSRGRAESSGVAYDYTNQVIYGVAALRARQLGVPLVPLAAWNGQRGDARGGTAGILARWERTGDRPTIIDMDQLLRQAAEQDPCLLPQRPSQHRVGPRSATSVEPAPEPGGEPTAVSEMRAMLFADVAGFSRRPETEVPLFVEHFLRPVNAMVANAPGQPLLENTWGDGLYMVFATVEDAGVFALRLREFVGTTNWTDKGFEEPLKIRIALHVGPVYFCRNPLTRRADYLGAHVNRAARLEGVTPENEVYATQAFAAIAFIERARGFTCEYVGEEVMPKRFGTFPTYLVRPFVVEREGD